MCPKDENEVSTLLTQIRDTDFLHPDCPSGCRSLPYEEESFYRSKGIHNNFCIYQDEIYVIESTRTKSFTCVLSYLSQLSICPANKLLCGGYEQGLPRIASRDTTADLLRIALTNRERIHPYCPGQVHH